MQSSLIEGQNERTFLSHLEIIEGRSPEMRDDRETSSRFKKKHL